MWVPKPKSAAKRSAWEKGIVVGSHRSSKSHKEKSTDKKSKKIHRHHHSKRQDVHKSQDSSSKRLPHDVKPIDEDDFYQKSTEFRFWLLRRRGEYLEELASDEAMRLFRKHFVTKWNAGKLDKMFYEGIPDHLLESTRRTRHKWSFVTKMDESEKLQLASTKDSVGVATRRSDLLQDTHKQTSSSSSKQQDEADGHRRDRDADRERGDERSRRRAFDRDAAEREDDRDRARRERKRFRRDHEHVMEELVPKETGREALLEKRRQVASRVHGAARAREEARDGLDLGEDFLMGSDDKDLQRRLASRQQGHERQEQARQERLEQAQAQEAERMQNFLRDMGIDPTSQQRITIAPRK